MTTTTDQRRATGAAINAMCHDLQKYTNFVIGRVTIHADAGQFTLEIVDRWGVVDAVNEMGKGDPLPDVADFTYTARGETLDDAFIALSHKLAGTEEAPF